MSLRLGLTGGIGSGKSTVAALLARHGATVIDADAIARSLTAPGGAALPAIVQTFGADALDAKGALDRAAMRAKVFDNAQARQQLEHIIHPLVMQEADWQAAAATAAGAPLLVFDIPLLAESGDRWKSRLDRVLVVDCEPETQIQRVMARSGLSAEQVQRIMATQANRSARLAIADHTIANGAGVTPDQLRQSVAALVASFGL